MSPSVVFGLILFQFELRPHPFLKLLLLVTVYGAEFTWRTVVMKITYLAGRCIHITMILYSFNGEFSYLAQSRSTRTNICICPFIVDKLRSIVLPSGRFTSVTSTITYGVSSLYNRISAMSGSPSFSHR